MLKRNVENLIRIILIEDVIYKKYNFDSGFIVWDIWIDNTFISIHYEINRVGITIKKNDSNYSHDDMDLRNFSDKYFFNLPDLKSQIQNILLEYFS